MVTCLFGIPSCISFICRHSWSICMMAIAVGLVVVLLISLVFGPSVVLGDLRSWFCGTCTVWQVCSLCEPHLNVSPKCECRANLNNCNCNCISHKNLQNYHHEWNSQLLVNQHNIHAAQQNANHFKRQLLLWLIDLAIFNALLLFFIIILIVFTPTLLRRCAKWKSNLIVKRRQHFMRKHNLMEKSSSFVVEADVQLSQLRASHIAQQPLSHSDLLRKFESQKQLISKLQQELQSSQASHKSTTSAAQPSII